MTLNTDALTKLLGDLRKVIHPLTQQGEDRIWRAAERGCALIDKAEAEVIALRAEIAQMKEALDYSCKLATGAFTPTMAGDSNAYEGCYNDSIK